MTRPDLNAIRARAHESAKHHSVFGGSDVHFYGWASKTIPAMADYIEQLEAEIAQARNGALDEAIAALKAKQSADPMRHGSDEEVHESALTYAVEIVAALKTQTNEEDMSGSVVERFGGSVDEDGNITHDDRSATWERADCLAGKRLDRRKAYAIIYDEVCGAASWSSACSGCTEIPEMTTGPDRGLGCHECGYTGRTRNRAWIPLVFEGAKS